MEDYCYVLPWGMCSENSIEKMIELGRKEFKMRDGSLVFLVASDDFDSAKGM